MQIAFSEEQWSWSRVDQLGGMAPENPRQWLGWRCEPPYSQRYSHQARAARLTPVNTGAATNVEGVSKGSNGKQLVDSIRA